MNSASANALLGLSLAAILLGCEQPRRLTSPERLNLDERFGSDSNPPPVETTVAPPRSGEVRAGQSDWISPDDLPWEAWYLQYLGAKRIGYSHLVVREMKSDSEENRIAIERRDVIELSNADEVSRIVRQMESVEHADGRLISILDSLEAEGTTEVTEGDFLQESQLRLKKNGALTIVNWEAGVWGLSGVQAIFMQSPPQPAEMRTATVYLPQLRQLAQVKMQAGRPETTTLPGGVTTQLLPVEVQFQSEDFELASRNWINDRGEIMKTVALSGPNISTFRVPADIAMRTRDELRMQGLLGRSIAITDYPDPPPENRAVYTLMLKLSADSPLLDISTIFTDGSHQTVRFPVALSVEVTVHAEPTAVKPATEDELSECLASSPIVAAAAPEISDLVEKLLAGEPEDDPEIVLAGAERARAIALAQGVFQLLKPQPFAGEFPDAVQVVQRNAGDCTGYAAVLTAALRNCNIPARVASGFRVDPSDPSQMIFHMWTEAWLDQTWLALDAMQGGVADVNRIKVLHHSLSGENPYSAILPVLEIMSSLDASYEP